MTDNSTGRSLKNGSLWAKVVADICPCALEVRAGCSEVVASLGYTMRFCLKKERAGGGREEEWKAAKGREGKGNQQ